MIRGYRVRKFRLTDHEKVPSVTISKAPEPYTFREGRDSAQYTSFRNYLDSHLPGSLTAAFLVIKNDSIIYERYFNGFDESSRLPSFSVVKSFVSTLVSIALEEGKIHALNDPVTNYLPELLKRDDSFRRITLQHLLDMRSGIRFNEGNYNAKDDVLRLAFRPNLLKHALKLDIETEPGKEFKYQSINTELLALVVERATGKKISAYLQEKLWHPLGAQYDATWNVDSRKRKQEIAFAGLNATARDFAKLGQLFLNKGVWQGRRLVDSSWISLIADVRTMKRYEGYKNQWWSNPDYRIFSDATDATRFLRSSPGARGIELMNGKAYRIGYYTGAFHALGILQQFIYVNPANNVVIVRLGRFWRHPSKYGAQFIYETGKRLN